MLLSSFHRPAFPSDSPPPQLHRFNPLPFPVRRRFSRSIPYPGSPLCAYQPQNVCSRDTCVSYVRINELHVSGKHPTRKVIDGLELRGIDEIMKINGFEG